VPLSDEHVVPYGLSGDVVLSKSSCARCAAITSKFERSLLRGHWLPYRQFLGLKSRRNKQLLPDLQITVEHASGKKTSATLPTKKHCCAVSFKFPPPTILSGLVSTDIPFAKEMALLVLGRQPATVNVNGIQLRLDASDKINYPVDFSAPDLCRFLAKVAHSYAIFRRGINSCEEFFLPRYILGEESGAMTYVGGASSVVLQSWLPGNGLHSLVDRLQGQFLSVYIQLFRHDNLLPPPIYEVVVGRLHPQKSSFETVAI
jgi:hypothetical protein